MSALNSLTVIAALVLSRIIPQKSVLGHVGHSTVAVLGCTPQISFRQTFVTFNERTLPSNGTCDWCANVVAGYMVRVVRTWRRPNGNCPLDISRHSLLKCGKHYIHHPWQIVDVTPNANLVATFKCVDGGGCPLVKAFPTSDDTNTQFLGIPVR